MTVDVEEYAAWSFLRTMRDAELAATDWFALKDHTLSAERREYRQFLRDLPQNYDSCADAWAAWEANPRPE